jgi:hypothetical protein
MSAAGIGAAAAASTAAGESTGTATTVTVCASGCTYTTIANALAAAVSGEVIKVEAGTYAGGFVVRTPVTIQGAGKGATIISGGAANNGTVVEVEASPVTIKFVTITGGTWTPTGGQTGGGVVVGSGTLNLSYCYVEGNQGNDGAGGAGINSYATTNISNCAIYSNNAGGGAGQGGGIHVGGSGVVTMTGSSVQGNDAAFGGGFDIDSGGSVTLTNTHVIGNTGASQGGGIDNNGSLTATGVSVYGNNTGGQGGGIIQNGAATLTHSSVLHNSTTSPVGNGGGIYVTSGQTVTLNSTNVQYNLPDNLVQG